MLMAVDSAQGNLRAAFGSPPVAFGVIADSQATASLRSATQEPPRLLPSEAEHRHPVIAAQSPRVLPLLAWISTDRESPNAGVAYPIHLTQEFGSDRY
jgi:hypothetical protein